MIIIFIALFFLISFLVYASYSIEANIYVKSYCKNPRAINKIALTFDDGPHPIYTPMVLDILDRYNIKATFFLIGREAEKYPNLVGDILKRGHSIGNHTYSHSVTFTFCNTNKVIQDMLKCNNILHNETRCNIKYFRPPFGVTNLNIAKGIKKLNMQSIGWSIRSLDTMGKDNEVVCNRVIERLHNGAIILLHDNREKIVDLLNMIITESYNKGFSFVSLQELQKSAN